MKTESYLVMRGPSNDGTRKRSLKVFTLAECLKHYPECKEEMEKYGYWIPTDSFYPEILPIEKFLMGGKSFTTLNAMLKACPRLTCVEAKTSNGKTEVPFAILERKRIEFIEALDAKVAQAQSAVDKIREEARAYSDAFDADAREDRTK